MSYLKVVESRIEEAMASGAFAGLAGEGRPLDLRRGELSGDLWLGHHLLENGGMLPPWLLLAREIEEDLAGLSRIDREHERLSEEARCHGLSPALAGRLRERRAEFEAAARAVRAKQDRFNIEAPGRLSERPGLWVEFHLARLDARLPAARGAIEPSP